MDKHLEEMWLAYVEGKLSPEQEETLAAELRKKPELMDVVYGDMQMDSLLRQMKICDKEFVGSVQERLNACESQQEFTECVMSEISGDKKGATGKHRARRKARRVDAPHSRKLSLWLPMSVAAAFLALISAHLINIHNVDSARKSIMPVVVKINGSAHMASDSNIVLRQGDVLAPTQTIYTLADSSVNLAYPDGTVVEVDANTRVRMMDGPDGKAGKKLKIEYGRLLADVAPQPAGYPMQIYTEQSVTEVLGTKFTLESDKTHTRLDMTRGKVGFTRLLDRTTAIVTAGQYIDTVDMIVHELDADSRQSKNALGAINQGAGSQKNQDPFVAGINFGGESVVLDGHRWMGHKEALDNGLSFTPAGKANAITTEIPVPDANLSRVLNTAAWVSFETMNVSYPLDNGKYEIYLYVMENYNPNKRKFDVLVEGKVVSTGIGLLAMGQWKKYGPYAANITDGKLDLTLKQDIDSPHVMGMLVERVGAVDGN
ncbi:MAG: FecR domain-containing protein [Planctomycetes bacterium]|nr:FecR domain-containing protein [Planctomycetota bacterium]